MTSKQLAFVAYFEAIPQRPTFTQESKYGVPLDHLALGLPFQRLPVNGARGARPRAQGLAVCRGHRESARWTGAGALPRAPEPQSRSYR